MSDERSVAFVVPWALLGDLERSVVDDHQRLTGHGGVYQHQDRGWECAVCTILAKGDSMFRVPLSGRPPDGYFEEWAGQGYTWTNEPALLVEMSLSDPCPICHYVHDGDDCGGAEMARRRALR